MAELITIEYSGGIRSPTTTSYERKYGKLSDVGQRIQSGSITLSREQAREFQREMKYLGYGHVVKSYSVVQRADNSIELAPSLTKGFELARSEEIKNQQQKEAFIDLMNKKQNLLMEQERQAQIDQTYDRLYGTKKLNQDNGKLDPSGKDPIAIEIKSPDIITQYGGGIVGKTQPGTQPASITGSSGFVTGSYFSISKPIKSPVDLYAPYEIDTSPKPRVNIAPPPPPYLRNTLKNEGSAIYGGTLRRLLYDLDRLTQKFEGQEYQSTKEFYQEPFKKSGRGLAQLGIGVSRGITVGVLALTYELPSTVKGIGSLVTKEGRAEASKSAGQIGGQVVRNPSGAFGEYIIGNLLFDKGLKGVSSVSKIANVKLTKIMDPNYIPQESLNIRFVPDYSLYQTPEKLIKQVEGKNIQSIHTTQANLFNQPRFSFNLFGKEIKLGSKNVDVTELTGFPSAKMSDLRKDYGLLHFYKSVPDAKGTPTSYLAYAGIKGNNKIVSSIEKFVLREPDIKAYIFDDYITPTPKQLKKLGIEDINIWQSSQRGKTMVPAENIVGMSSESQIITPAKFEYDTITGLVIKSEGSSISPKKITYTQGSKVLEELPETKFTYYGQMREPSIFAELTGIENLQRKLGLLTEYKKIKIIPTQTLPSKLDMIADVTKKIAPVTDDLDLSLNPKTKNPAIIKNPELARVIKDPELPIIKQRIIEKLPDKKLGKIDLSAYNKEYGKVVYKTPSYEKLISRLTGVSSKGKRDLYSSVNSTTSSRGSQSVKSQIKRTLYESRSPYPQSSKGSSKHLGELPREIRRILNTRYTPRGSGGSGSSGGGGSGGSSGGGSPPIPRIFIRGFNDQKKQLFK
ncbi:MAG: hypothetical protein WD512_11010, partial [Candidatus Paceibacterota bacterium]